MRTILRLTLGVLAAVVVLLVVTSIPRPVDVVSARQHINLFCCAPRLTATVDRAIERDGGLPIPDVQWTPIALDCSTPTALGRYLIAEMQYPDSLLCDAFGTPMLVRGIPGRSRSTEAIPSPLREVQSECCPGGNCWATGFEVACAGSDGVVANVITFVADSNDSTSDVVERVTDSSTSMWTALHGPGSQSRIDLARMVLFRTRRLSACDRGSL